jgi:membrane associated rhomboid family serine protease
MTPWTARLLFANVAAHVLLNYVAPPPLQQELMRQLAFVPGMLFSRPWTAVTYMFLHAGFGHILFNMIALFFFGPRLEARLGGKGFVGLYFVAGLMGAILSWVFMFVGLTHPLAPIVGASGAIFGVMVGFARYWPREQILIWGVLPVEARWLVAVMTGLSLFGGFTGAQAGIAHFAHLGGFLGGWGYLWFSDRRARGRKTLAQMVKERSPTGGLGRSRLRRWEEIEVEGLHEVNRENLERIREKIREDGPQSLTRREREFMDRMAERSQG